MREKDFFEQLNQLLAHCLPSVVHPGQERIAPFLRSIYDDFEAFRSAPGGKASLGRGHPSLEIVSLVLDD